MTLYKLNDEEVNEVLKGKNILLSNNFSMLELCKSQTAIRYDINNWPQYKYIIYNLFDITNKILQPVREHFNIPIIPSSGYRCEELNTKIGGSKHSDHMYGKAVDFEVPGIPNYDLAIWIKNNLKYKKLILEHYIPVSKGGDINSGWVHISYDKEFLLNKEFTISKYGTQEGLIQ